MYDIIIIGGGPAGLTAAVYGRRNGKSVLIMEKSVFGGQIVNSPKVENIPGFDSISGDEFADRYLDQAMGQGAEVALEEAVSVEKRGDLFYVTGIEGNVYEGRTLIDACGCRHRLLGLEGEEDLVGHGISFCATCDGDFYRDQRVVVIGGGNSAFVEANLLASLVSKLVILQDLPYFTAEEKSQEALFAHKNVETHTGTKILAYEVNDGKLCGVRYLENGEEKVAECEGVFLAVGLIPDNRLFAEYADLDGYGYVDAKEDCSTKTAGLFVAGDCRKKGLRQVATACSDGAVAAIAACRYLG